MRGYKVTEKGKKLIDDFLGHDLLLPGDPLVRSFSESELIIGDTLCTLIYDSSDWDFLYDPEEIEKEVKPSLIMGLLKTHYIEESVGPEVEGYLRHVGRMKRWREF